MDIRLLTVPPTYTTAASAIDVAVTAALALLLTVELIVSASSGSAALSSRLTPIRAILIVTFVIATCVRLVLVVQGRV